MTDYYRVDNDGSIFLITEDRIVSDTPKTITTKSDGGCYTHRYKKAILFTDFESAKQQSEKEITRNLDRLKKQIKAQEKNLEMIKLLNEEILRHHHYKSFITVPM